MNQEAQKAEKDYSPYCKICGACGEDGCCPPARCVMHPEGEYCDHYLSTLKRSDSVLDELVNWLYDNEDQYRAVIDKWNELDSKWNKYDKDESNEKV